MFLLSVQLGVTLGVGTFLVVICWLLTKPTPTATSLDGGMACLEHIVEGAKWMSGIQTAALGLLSLLIFQKDPINIRPLAPFAQGAALAASVYLGAALFCSAWVLSAVPSLSVRLHAILANDRSNDFDVYELPIYGWMGKPTYRSLPASLGIRNWPSLTMAVLMNLQHWFWALGLLAIGLLVLSLFFNPLVQCA